MTQACQGKVAAADDGSNTADIEFGGIVEVLYVEHDRHIQLFILVETLS